MLVISIEPGSPAAASGLQERDLIVGFNERTIRSVDDLHRVLTESRIGIPGRLHVIRRAQQIELMVTPKDLDAGE